MLICGINTNKPSHGTYSIQENVFGLSLSVVAVLIIQLPLSGLAKNILLNTIDAQEEQYEFRQKDHLRFGVV
jgi:hypothetical protein